VGVQGVDRAAGATAEAATAAAAAGSGGVRRSSRATAGKKPLDIMFTQGRYLALPIHAVSACHLGTW
jgi:hypothetical protein